MALSARQAAAFTGAEVQARGLRFYEVVWDGTRRTARGRYLADRLVDQRPVKAEPPRVNQPIVSVLTADERQRVVRDVLATGYQATGQKWGFSKFTVTMIMRRQGIKKRDQKRATL